MGLEGESRSVRKRTAIVDAATSLFFDRGYDRTSMDDIATLAAVSKPTVYKHFADKEQLFAEIVGATTDRVDALVRLVAESLAKSDDVETDLGELALQFITILMQPRTLQLRRLVIANADRFPDVGRHWYEQGFERVLATLATSFQRLADQQMLRVDDPLLAANHFVGMLLWIPVNRAMFIGDHRSGKADLEHYARSAVRAFLGGYGGAIQPSPTDGGMLS
jgi:TetR/AcrR family transcriptional repressor of mexJK operon